MQTKRIVLWWVVLLLWLATLAIAVGIGYELGWESTLTGAASPVLNNPAILALGNIAILHRG